MSGPAIRGWCPGALRPMPSGDGLVVRVRPPGGRMDPAQGAALADCARRWGSGWLDLASRGGVQIRGVAEADHPALIAALQAAGLVDADARAEARRNIIVTPFADAATDRLAADLAALLAEGPDVPAKFGFAVDDGPAPRLADASADIRIERAADGQRIVRADGCPLGAPVTDPVTAAADLARWFLAQGGAPAGRGRMAALIARGALPRGALAPTLAPAPALPAPPPGPVPQGVLVAAEFGLLPAATLAALSALGPLRTTPWRMLLVQGASSIPGLSGLVPPGDPRLRVFACTGAPGCVQGLQPTRPLARRLAAGLPHGAVLHVSGCAKGCAHPDPAELTLTGTPDGFDLVRGGRAGDMPERRGLDPARFPLGTSDASL